MTCGECELLQDIDKSQDGGYCILDWEFHKFHNLCDKPKSKNKVDELFKMCRSEKKGETYE